MSDILDFSFGSITLGEVLMGIVYALLTIAAVRIAEKLLCRAIDNSRIPARLKTLFNTIIKVLGWILIIFAAANIFGIPMSSLLAILSVIGLALSLAIQNVLGNLFSGATILGMKPFTDGNFVTIGDVSGTVTKMGIFYTTLTTPDNRVVHIPNSDVAASRITNVSANPTRRCDIVVGASYDSPTAAVRKALLEAAEYSKVLREPAPVVLVEEYQSSCITYTLRYWTAGSDYLDAKAHVTEAIRDTFDKYGVIFTYDHLNVHIDTVNSDK